MKERLAAAVERLGKYHAPMIVADFWEMFEELLNWTIEEHPQTSELIERLSDRGTACYVITFARLLTSLYLRENAETLIHFLPDGAGDMHTFVTQNVSTAKAHGLTPQELGRAFTDNLSRCFFPLAAHTLTCLG